MIVRRLGAKVALQVSSVLGVAVLALGCASPTAPTADLAVANLEPIFQFMDADPWIHPVLGEPIGPWARRQLRGVDIRIDPSLADDIGARSNLEARLMFWRPKNADLTSARQAATLIHEARHFEGYRHTCGSQDLAGDRSMAEGGAFAVQIIYLEHVNDLSIAQWLKEHYIGCR